MSRVGGGRCALLAAAFGLLLACGALPVSADWYDDAVKKAMAERGYVAESGDLVADPVTGRIYTQGKTRNGAATLAIDAMVLSLRAVNPLTGRIALDDVHRRLIVDEPARGLHVLAAPGLREERLVPLPAGKRQESCLDWDPFPAPAVDATTGRAYVGRGSTVRVVDTGTGRAIAWLDDVGHADGPVVGMLADGPGRRLYVVQVANAGGGNCDSRERLTILSLPNYRVVARPAIDGAIGQWSSVNGVLTALSGYYWPPRGSMWRMRDGVYLRNWKDWRGGSRAFPDAERHRLLIDNVWVDDRTLEPLTTFDFQYIGHPRALYVAGDDLALIMSESGGLLHRQPITEPPPPLAALPVLQRLSKVSGPELVSDGESAPTLLVGAEVPRKDVAMCGPASEVADDLEPVTSNLVRLLTDSDWRDIGAWACGRVGGTSLVLSPAFSRDGTAFAMSSPLMRTTDGGRSWQPVGGGIDSWGIGEMSLSPAFARDGLVLALTGRGPAYRSVDRGKTWREIGPLFGDVTFAPGYPADRRIFALDLEGDDLVQIVQSTDAGRTWRKLNSQPMSKRPDRIVSAVRAVAAPDLAGGVALFAETDEPDYGHTEHDPPYYWVGGAPALTRSVDGGRTWQIVLGPFGQDVSLGPLRSLPTPGGPLLIAVLSGYSLFWQNESRRMPDRVLRSDDLGDTWHVWRLPAGLDLDTLVALPDGSVVSVQPDGGLQPVDLDRAKATLLPPPTPAATPTVPDSG